MIAPWTSQKKADPRPSRAPEATTNAPLPLMAKFSNAPEYNAYVQPDSHIQLSIEKGKLGRPPRPMARTPISSKTGTQIMRYEAAPTAVNATEAWAAICANLQSAIGMRNKWRDSSRLTFPPPPRPERALYMPGKQKATKLVKMI